MRPPDPVMQRLVDRVLGARSRRAALEVRGGGTKAFYGEAPRGETLELGDLAGITSYEPSELAVTVRAGTTVRDLEAALAERGQCLAFEPPRFGDAGTVGGMVASGLSGPARASVGCLRDFVTGASVLTGRGELLHFGGQVMKNVAGYDLARVFAGSWGVLGVLCAVSLKVVSFPPASATLSFEFDEARAVREVNSWSVKALPLQASAWQDGNLRVRLAGAAAAVRAARASLGGVPLAEGEAEPWWKSVRDQTHEFFRPSAAALDGGECLWRLSLPATAAPLTLPGRRFTEWGGAQRWLRGVMPGHEVRAAAAAAGGHATLVRAADKSAGAFTRPSEVILRIHRGLKQAFDPDGILNPGRLYPDL